MLLCTHHLHQGVDQHGHGVGATLLQCPEWHAVKLPQRLNQIASRSVLLQRLLQGNAHIRC
jgi:hypothetical protein